MTGTSCTHMFHYDCCMQWTESGNDLCPYCRENMMTANEFFEAAKEELGDRRVDKLKKVNEEAEARIAAFFEVARRIRQATNLSDILPVSPPSPLPYAVAFSEAARRIRQAFNMSDIPAASPSPPSNAGPASGQPNGNGEFPSENNEDVSSGDLV
jgi:hypothetical protein